MCFTDLAGAEDWFIRWRRGVTTRIDVGFDVLIVARRLRGAARFV